MGSSGRTTGFGLSPALPFSPNIWLALLCREYFNSHLRPTPRYWFFCGPAVGANLTRWQELSSTGMILQLQADFPAIDGDDDPARYLASHLPLFNADTFEDPV